MTNLFQFRSGSITLYRDNNSFDCSYAIVSGELPDAKINELLHPDERKKYHSFPFNARQQSFILGRIAVKYAILVGNPSVCPKNIHIDSGVFNYPYLKAEHCKNISISLSHSQNMAVAIAFPEHHIMGIDLEIINENYLAVMKKILLRKEEELIENVNGSLISNSVYLWTSKEALSKAIKTGFSADIEIFEINSVKKVGLEIINSFKFFHQYKTISVNIGDYVCSIALPKKTEIDLSSFYNSLKEIYLSNHENSLL